MPLESLTVPVGQLTVTATQFPAESLTDPVGQFTVGVDAGGGVVLTSTTLVYVLDCVYETTFVSHFVKTGPPT